MNQDADFLRDILEAIEGIGRYACRGRQAFEQDELLQTWMVRQLQNIGEASRSLSEGLRASHPEVPWREIIAMRNVLVHHYFGVRLSEVWAAIENDVPRLQHQVEAMLTTLSDDGNAP